ncbi:MAG: hypothetical protein P4M00_08865 [Azospirillaceae bacterium]|nr:hypothetical protein [Azospirillaceae bacterium]
MANRRSNVAIGDRFSRASQPDKTYKVYAIDSRPGFPIHARLHDESYDRDQITVSLDALSDPLLFVRVARRETEG